MAQGNKKFEKCRTKNILDICTHFAFLHLIKLIANISVEERDIRWKSYFPHVFAFRIVPRRMSAFTIRETTITIFY